jgi:hypothetical protein
MDVGITPMPSCCVSFSFYFGKKNYSCNDKNKTMDLHMSSNFAFTTTMVTSFDLWMSKGVMNTFTLAINCLNDFGPLCMRQQNFP